MKGLVYFFGLLSSLIFVACEMAPIEHNHYIDLSGGNEETSSPKSSMVVLANINQHTVSSRTELSEQEEEDKQSLVWVAGDEISLYDGTQTAIFSTEDGDTQSAEFTCKNGQLNEKSNRFIAFYPSYLTVDNMTLPTVQNYVKDNVSDFPMYAYSTNKTLNFKNLCGIVRLRLKTTTDAGLNLSKIILSSGSGGMSGEFTLNGYNTAVVKDEKSNVTLQCGDGVLLNDVSYTDFNIIVPEGEYEPLFITVADVSGDAVTYKSKAPVTVSRSGITRISLIFNTKDFSGSLEDLTIYDSDAGFEDERGDDVEITFSMTDEDVDLVVR